MMDFFLIKKIIYHSNWEKNLNNDTFVQQRNSDSDKIFIQKKKKKNTNKNSFLVIVQNSKISKEQTSINCGDFSFHKKMGVTFYI